MRRIVAEAVINALTEEGYEDYKLVTEYSGRGMIGRKVTAIGCLAHGNGERIIPYMIGLLVGKAKMAVEVCMESMDDHWLQQTQEVFLDFNLNDLPDTIDSWGRDGIVMYSKYTPEEKGDESELAERDGPNNRPDEDAYAEVEDVHVGERSATRPDDREG